MPQGVRMRAESGIPQAAALPVGFEDLLPYLHWAIPTERGRHSARENASMEELQAFFAATQRRLADIVDYLRKRPPTGLSSCEQRLLDLGRSLMEVSVAVELYRQPTVINGFDRARITFG